MSHHGPGPVPNCWLRCPRKSETLVFDRFLAFKTPLSSAFKDQIPLDCIFLPEMVFGYCKTVKFNLGLWIDLTNTKRFYDRKIVESHGAKYVKLQCRGHGETPSLEQTIAFIELVDGFLAERPFDIIAVHCTHGFNRTGFLIASYLVERQDFSVDAAISVFAVARPPGIYKQDYIAELYRRYQQDEVPTQAPPLPEWFIEYDDSKPRKRQRGYDSSCDFQSEINEHSDYYENKSEYNEESRANDPNASTSNGGGGVSGTKRLKRSREAIIKNATFMKGVPGVTLVTDQPRLGDLQLKVQKMCGWCKNGFPGAQPVSMDQNNIIRLSEIPYRVSWKADGNRYMMLIVRKNEIYFFDRNHSCFEVSNLTFLKAGNLEEHLEDTLLDGEMVLDKFNGQITPRYLIYDIIKISNTDIGSKPFFPDRLDCIKREIIEPRHAGLSKGLIDRPSEPFGVRNKGFWEISLSVSLLGEKFAKNLLHEPDGLIFQPSTQPYTTGVCPDVLKWKPTDMNSVDFRLEITKESGLGIVTKNIGLLYVGGLDRPFDKIKYTKAIKELHNKIIECTFNQGKWVFMRERTDKTLPNSYSTAQAVVKSIVNPVTKGYLLDYIQSYGYKDDNIRMPPPSRSAHQHTQRGPPPKQFRQ